MDRVRENGPLFVGYYAAAWVGTGALTYAGISHFGPDAAVNALEALGVHRIVDLSSLHTAGGSGGSGGNAMAALLVTELLEPVRLPLVLLAVSQHKPNTAAGAARQANPGFVTRQWYALTDTAKKYGKFFVVYYTGVWAVTGVLSVATIELVGADAALNLLRDYVTIDTSRFNPTLVNVGVGLAINELIEPLRFPFGVLTVKPAFTLYQRLTGK